MHAVWPMKHDFAGVCGKNYGKPTRRPRCSCGETHLERKSEVCVEKKQNQGNAFLLIWALRVWTVGDVEVHAAVVAAGRKAHEREEPVREAEACWRCTCMLSSHDNAHNIEDAQVQGESPE